MKKQILLVFTGGTIGSQLSGDTINTDSSAGFKLLQLFNERDRQAESVCFKILQPLQILSENLHPSHWNILIAAIESEDLSNYDGIIVTHGTDTLAFSAAMLSQYFNPLNIPLLLVSSHLPLDHPDANGMANFLCAVDFIRQQILRGVFVAYQNPGQAMQVYLGSRLNSCLPLSSDFIGLQSQALMQYADGQFYHRQDAKLLPCSPLSLNADFSSRILLIKPYPGLNYSHFQLDQVDVVLHDLYHSGTACASVAQSGAHSLVEFIQHCRQRQLKVYLAAAAYSENAYASTRQLLEAGAEIIWDVSIEVAYAKLLLAYGNFTADSAIDAFLRRDLAWEHVGSTAV